MGKSVPGACWKRTSHRHADDRLHAREGAPLGSGRKRGEQKQAVGRSRGGRNTKIHALADAKGRLLAILLTGSEATTSTQPASRAPSHHRSHRSIAVSSMPALPTMDRHRTAAQINLPK